MVKSPAEMGTFCRISHLTIGITLLFGFLCTIYGQQLSGLTDVVPFFFYCKQYDRLASLERDWDPSSVKIVNVNLAGNPKFYVAGRVYKVTIKLLEDFDSSRITAVYSANLNSPLGQKLSYKRKMCSILHSQMKQSSSARTEFLWMAPPEDVGCVDFVGNFMRQETTVLKDARIYHICPAIDPLSTDSVVLSGLDQDGVILRDDFEAGYLIPTIWSHSEGFQVTNSCQPIFHGLSATACPAKQTDNELSSSFQLTTVALNSSSAGSLQFTFGHTSCSMEKSNATDFLANVSLFYGKRDRPDGSECSNWKTIRPLQLLKSRNVINYVIPLPKSARQPGTCFRWSVDTIKSDCIGIDDVIITNTVDRRTQLHADFDPLHTSDWLSLPGGQTHSECKGSRGNALVFNAASSKEPRLVSSQDLKLDEEPIQSDDILWRANFDTLLPNERWEFFSAQVDDGCQVGESNRRLVLQHSSNSSVASACSPLLDLSLAGNLRFRLEPYHFCNTSNQNGTSQVKLTNHAGRLNVWIEHDDIKKKRTVLSMLDLNEDHVGISLAIPSKGQIKEASLCWQFNSEHELKNEWLWIVDDIYLLPVLPSSIEHVLQFRLNTNCNLLNESNSSLSTNPVDEDEFHVVVQYSNDMGNTWKNFHELCLPPSCSGALSNVTETSWSNVFDLARWERISLPLPYALLTDYGRIRFLQKGWGRNGGKHWAVDDIHLDHCPMACNGHGTCLGKGICSCDDNYQGEGCQFTIQNLETTLRENFEGSEGISKSFSKFLGGRLSSKCHPFGAGIAAVFDHSGQRQMVTIDLDTTESHLLQFGLGINEAGSRYHYHCPGPDREIESIYVHSSCNGGMTWSLLKIIQPMDKQSDRAVQIYLTSNSRGSSCRFKFWQMQHSGAGKDIWAIDDVYIGPNQTQSLMRNGSLIRLSPVTDAFVGRHTPEEFCKRDGVMFLNAKEVEETQPVRIEPFSLIQFEVAVGCDPSTQALNDNHVVVQYSIDGGKQWNDLNGTRRHVSYLQDWKRIGLKLPPVVQSEETRFRMAQTSRLSDRSLLAIDYFYAGPDKCPELCRGNGRCSLSGCICDDGFSGSNCLPDSPLRSLQLSDQDVMNVMIGGHHYTMDQDGCLIRGAHNYLFGGLGMRLLETKEIQYSSGVTLFFFLRLGDCESSHDGSYDVNVRLEVSWDGGSDWNLLREYRTPFNLHPQLEQVEILSPWAISGNPPPFKVRFIQTGVHAKDRNIWSLAGLTSSLENQITDTYIDQLDSPLHENKDLWIVKNEPNPKSSCLVFDTNCLSRIAWYGALTHEVVLKVGDSIQFDLTTQHSDPASYADTKEEIMFQYSSNGGTDWHLVQPECFHSWSNCLGFRQSSRIDIRSLRTYRDDKRNRFHFETSDAMASKPILLRWIYHRARDEKHHPVRGFQIQSLYIGNPCPLLCSGHGQCWKSTCVCDVGFSGLDCSESDRPAKSSGFYDTFAYLGNSDSSVQLKSYWDRIIGGKLTPNYCNGHTDGIIFFGDKGPRLLQTTEIDTQNLRMVQFTLTVTSSIRHKQNCQPFSKRQSSSKHTSVGSVLVLDYSNDNGLTWNIVDAWPMIEEVTKKRLGAKFPTAGKTPATIVRWWQLTFPNSEDKDGLQWYLDDVLLNLNMTNPITFEYEMDQSDEPQYDLVIDELNTASTKIAEWLGWRDLTTREPLYPVDTMLRNLDPIDAMSTLSFAETWDMEIIDPTFAQFQVLLSSKVDLDEVEVRFEYSTDMGRNWHLVEADCRFLHQLAQQCEYLHPPSRYKVSKENNATRITVHLPKRSITESTRFRWISDSKPVNLPIAWGIGHVYIGGICPWMCSGHGTCHNGVCNCDIGYGNADCVPIEPLSNHLVHHFEGSSGNGQVLMSGGVVSGGCGILMSGQAGVFYQDGLRYFETVDLDLTTASFLQMALKFNCGTETENFIKLVESSHHRLLLQYSVNGGITWMLIQEIKRHNQHDSQLLIVDMMRIPDLTNCTRFRLWQPVHAGEGWDSWAVDGLILHSIQPSGIILTSNFDSPKAPNTFLTWFGGQIQSFCSRDDALVLSSELGDRQVLTADTVITGESVLQFEVNVGCGSVDFNLELPVRLEYSNDGGRHWNLVVNDMDRSRNPYNRMPNQTPTVYSSKTTNKWRRETVLLSHLESNRPVRFRWYQGYLNGTDAHLAPQWAIRNVILSPQCPEVCSGHGRCTRDGSCDCDSQYQGYACETVNDPNPQDFHESFHDHSLVDLRWSRMIGGEYEKESSSEVGIGGLYIMNRPGVQILETVDLNLSNANFVQFYLDTFEVVVSQDSSLLFVEYSVNGGIEWTMFEVIPLDGPPIRKLFQVPFPSRALTPATRIKWSHINSQNIQPLAIWTVDEIYVGGESYAKNPIETEFISIESTQNDWMFIAGGKLETTVCDSNVSSLHFSGKGMAMTKDVKDIGQMYLQYETSTACNHPKACNRIKLEYSDNYGLTWRDLPRECQPGEEVNCDAYDYHTELLSGATGYRRVITLPLPPNKGIVRFRWSNNNQLEYDWSLHWVYIGSICGDCNGRGRCFKGNCICDSDWKGNNCELPSTPLISSVRETFQNGWNSSVWSRINGGHASSMCGTLDWSQALHFHEACDRYAETRELNLSQVHVVQFHLRSDCSNSFQHNSKGEALLFQYSLNGGVKWQTALTLSLEHFFTPKLVSFVVPKEVNQVPVKLRWWQLKPVGRSLVQDWAIDSFIFGSPLNLTAGLESQRPEQRLKETGRDFQEDQPSQWRPFDQSLEDEFGHTLWWRHVNSEKVDSFCGQKGKIWRGRSNTAEESILETSDFLVATIKDRVLSFDITIGDCGIDSTSATATPIKTPVQFEISFNHGINWNLFHPFKTRGDKGESPQIPSVYYNLDKWQTFQYSLDFTTGKRFIRFRWRHSKSSSPTFWAVNNFRIERFRDFPRTGLKTLSEDFNGGIRVKPHWRFFSGGKIVLPDKRLGDGAVAHFQGPGLELLQTVELDLTFARNIQFILLLPNRGRIDDGDSFQKVIFQCSRDHGLKWKFIEEYSPGNHSYPTLVHVGIPIECQYIHSMLRWWQPIATNENIKKPSSWLIDNIAIEYAQEELIELYDNFKFETLNTSLWLFHPRGIVSKQLCDELQVENSLIFNSDEDSQFVGITSKHISINQNYAAYFKIRTSCGAISCSLSNNQSHIRFEMKQGYEHSSWSLVRPDCLPSSTHSLCEPHKYHKSTTYSFGHFNSWKRVTIPLKSLHYLSPWQFRWITHQVRSGEKYTWAIKDVYIGPMCPFHCHGHGDCILGRCHCDSGFQGLSCSISSAVLSSVLPVLDNFDEPNNSSPLWESIIGGSIQTACGSLLPLAHGKHLYFNGCGSRMATTVAIDGKKVKRIAFVIRIGTPQHSPSCRVQLSNTFPTEMLDRGVLLQYSFDGVDWFLLASHGIQNFVQPLKMIYGVPITTNSTIQFRWWQPYHGGPNWDHWALDNIEILI